MAQYDDLLKIYTFGRDLVEAMVDDETLTGYVPDEIIVSNGQGAKEIVAAISRDMRHWGDMCEIRGRALIARNEIIEELKIRLDDVTRQRDNLCDLWDKIAEAVYGDDLPEDLGDEDLLGEIKMLATSESRENLDLWARFQVVRATSGLRWEQLCKVRDLLDDITSMAEEAIEEIDG